MPGADAQSAIDSGDSQIGTDAMSRSAEQQSGAKPASDRPESVDPVQAMAPESNERMPASPGRQADLQYDSALTDYDRYEDSETPLWVEANERVGQIGGWREYAKELYTPAPEPATAEPEPTLEPELGGAQAPTDAAVMTTGDRPTSVDPARAKVPSKSESEPERSIPKALLDYDSVLANYARYEESDGPNWIEANERVGEIGGWREYAKELFEPAPSTTDDGAGQ